MLTIRYILQDIVGPIVSSLSKSTAFQVSHKTYSLQNCQNIHSALHYSYISFILSPMIFSAAMMVRSVQFEIQMDQVFIPKASAPKVVT